jgi:hypothetical protein
MGFDSEEGFIEMDKDCDMANGIWVEMMELKTVVVKKTSEKGTRGEGQTPFGKMVKCDDFVYIFHGERFTKGGAPIDKILVLEQSLGSKLIEVVEGALTVDPRTTAAPPSSSHPSPISWAPFLDPLAMSCSGAAGKGAGRFGWIGIL